MSDIQDQSKVIDGGGMLQGTDGKLSFRRIIGLGLAVMGAASLIVAMVLMASLAKDTIAGALTVWHIVFFAMFMAPGAIMLMFFLLITQQITTQAIAGIVEQVKGAK